MIMVVIFLAIMLAVYITYKFYDILKRIDEKLTILLARTNNREDREV